MAAYPIVNSPCGFAALIYMTEEGISKYGPPDCNNSKRLWGKSLDCEIKPCRNPSKQDLDTFAAKLMKEIDNNPNKHDMFSLTFIGHGGEHDERSFIMLSNGTICFMKDLYGMFRCKGLLGKPKLFFIQACRGDRSEQTFDFYGECSNPTKGLNSDIYFLHSSFQGTVSYFNLTSGESPFISAMCEVFEKDYKMLDLQNMALKVKEKCNSTTYNGYAQTVTVGLDTLDKPLYFSQVAQVAAAALSQLKGPHSFSQPFTSFTRCSSSTLSKVNPQQRKKAFIMNFIKFSNMRFRDADRDGAEPDSKNLFSTFTTLGYEVIIGDNMNKLETNDFLDAIQQDKCITSLLLVISSHGENGDTFFLSDGNKQSLMEVQNRFTDEKCPQLKGKPKILLCNYARGQLKEKKASDGIGISRADQRIPRSDQRIPMKYEFPHHMITIHASREGFVTFRKRATGSLFILHLCNVLREEGNLSIQNIFDRLYYKMTEDQYASTPEMNISAPFPQFTF